MEMESCVALTEIQAAAERLRGRVHRTPVLENHTLAALSGRQLFFKAEFLQKTGSFKARGALNACLLLASQASQASQAQEARPLSTHSSGNHAQALAWAASQVGLGCHIVMPSNSPQCKKDAVAGYGATVYFSEPTQRAREEMATAVTQATNAHFIHPSENPMVIAGQGTVAVELLEQVPDLQAIIVPIGGGGLCSGIAVAAKALRPEIVILAAEPEAANDAFLSKQTHSIIRPAQPPVTIADGLKTTLGPNTFPIVDSLVDEVLTVSEAEIRRALLLVWQRAKMLIEPSAAVGVAVALSAPFKEKWGHLERVGIILCGGNVDIDNIPTILHP